jgi:large subunit ribosomal protein L17
MFRNLATSLVLHNRIETTLPKAKELKRIADKLVTLGKNDTLHARRQAMTYLFAVNRTETGDAKKWTPVHRLFTVIAPRYTERNGGYTRVIRTRKRDGDKAQMAMIEFVEAGVAKEKTEKRKKRRVVKSDSSPQAAAE